MIYLHWLWVTVYGLVTLVVMLKVLMDNRQPSRTMAWILVLWFLPLLGIIFYFFFGQNTRKERLISRRSLGQLSKRAMLEFAGQKGLQLPDEHRPLMQLLNHDNTAFPFKDNEVDIYTNGYDFFLSLLQAIGQARDHIHIDIYIFNDDELGRLIADALIDRARQGVEVRLIYDDVGCWRVSSSFFERMRDAEIDVHAYMPVKFPAFTSKVNYRNHRKLVVIDGEVGFIGGMNFATRYVKGTGRQAWRDTHLRVRGGAVYGIQRAFLEDWYFVDRTLLSDHKYYPDLMPAIENNCLAQVVTSSPIAPWQDIMQGYVRILLEAKRYVYMESPYFMPTETILFAMRTAALTGVDVRLMIPMRGNSKIVEWASISYVMETLAAGVKVYLYEAGFNHSKFLVCDDRISSCGSTNVDFRSFEHNFESNIFFFDKAMALRMKAMFLDDQTHCLPIGEVRKVHSRSFFHRLWESILRLLSPLL